MNTLEVAIRLHGEGRFTQALKALNDEVRVPAPRGAWEVLRAELLERVGRFGQARAVLHGLGKSGVLSAAERSSSEFVLGKIDWEEGSTESAIAHLQRSVQLATESDDLHRRCWSRLWLLVSLADRSGPNAVAPILHDMRNDATRLGEPRVLAALHSFTGQMEAKRGLFTSARWHVRRSHEILASAPNLWIEAQLEFTKTNIAVLSSDYGAALRCGRHAAELAEESGGAACRRTCQGNLGFVFYSIGHFDEAVDCLKRAVAILPSAGDNHNAMMDTLARIRLAQGQTDECASLLDEIEGGIQVPGDRLLYSHRHTALTRAHLLARNGRIQEALNQADCALALANEAKDHFLWYRAQLAKALFLQQADRSPESIALLDSLVAGLVSQPPDFHAQYEVILACALASAGQAGAAGAHRRRAERLYTSIRHAPGLLELSQCWNTATQSAPALDPSAVSSPVATRPTAETLRAGSVLQAIAALMVHAGRPEFLAYELIDLLEQGGCVRKAVALLGNPNGEREILATIGGAGDVRTPDAWRRRLVVGSVRDQSVEVWLEPNDDIESIATINAVALLLSSIQEIVRGRAEREQRLTLWPIEDTPLEDGQTVVGGRMRELMALARRIATANVSVLITGESGTGKEILAHAVHNYSDSADKPFIPFNCAAVPREMLESQLFGHRRGAFTSADRENPGVIRTARGGTLFLDEIGELNLDLQPKLLRFLESGEICPLGDAVPFIVNVRVVAATNSNLEHAVKDGRFREDLFYRLNVFRLDIPPLRERRNEIPALVHHFLAKAAAEYRKGHVRIAEDTMEQLLLFPWPGNIRQLHNEIRRMVALAESGAVLTPRALSVEIANARFTPALPAHAITAAPLGGKLQPTLDRIECEMIKAAMRDHGGKVEEAARALGISRKGLYLKRQRFGL